MNSSRTWQERYRSTVRGCLLGGAVGDALGAPVEFLSLDRIPAVYPAGVFPAPPGLAKVTDDTQMTLFTVDGLIRAGAQGNPASMVYQAYLRWLETQRRDSPPDHPNGWLAAQPWLYAQRAPGNACISGLRAGRMGTLDQPQNPQSKGCGAVMRSAPFGLDPNISAEEAFALAAECATQTHGHPSGYLAAGAFAAMVRGLADGLSLVDAVDAAMRLLTTYSGHEETTAALRQALALRYETPTPEVVERLGGGWVAEEALAIGVYCALAYAGPTQVGRALLLAVNHSGDSDSTGSICGNLLGAAYGETALPADWVAALEGRGAILELADDLAMAYTQREQLRGDLWNRRYPAG